MKIENGTGSNVLLNMNRWNGVNLKLKKKKKKKKKIKKKKKFKTGKFTFVGASYHAKYSCLKKVQL